MANRVRSSFVTIILSENFVRSAARCDAIIFSLEVIMRGWKPINFNEFRDLCGQWKYNCRAEQRCGNENNFYTGAFCSASSCSFWRKLGRANITVSKITTHNNARQAPETPAQICPWCKSDLSYNGSYNFCSKCGCVPILTGKLLPC